MQLKRVLIRHPKDGREYTVEPAAFTSPKTSPERQSYAERGFQIVSYADGSPYEGPKTLREIERAAEARRAGSSQRQAERSDGQKGKGA